MVSRSSGLDFNTFLRASTLLAPGWALTSSERRRRAGAIPGSSPSVLSQASAAAVSRPIVRSLAARLYQSRASCGRSATARAYRVRDCSWRPSLRA